MDLSKLSIAELKELQTRIPAEIQKRKSEEKQQVLKELADLAAAKGFSLDELMAKKSAKTGSRKPAAVKYRHPSDSSLTWTGRGRKPLWVAQWLENGKTLEALAV
ncbi:MAG TPA: H-NS histone family protein [Rhodocyclaceae bacterium]